MHLDVFSDQQRRVWWHVTSIMRKLAFICLYLTSKLRRNDIKNRFHNIKSTILRLIDIRKYAINSKITGHRFTIYSKNNITFYRKLISLNFKLRLFRNVMWYHLIPMWYRIIADWYHFIQKWYHLISRWCHLITIGDITKIIKVDIT